MRLVLLLKYLILIVFLINNSVSARPSDAIKEPKSSVLLLCKEKKYHAAMRELPKVMAAWQEYTKLTGRTSEGAASYLYTTTMFTIASKGDADWGKILDDSEIPYNVKTDMIFEILELRLGKGAIYVGNQDNFIVPVPG